MGQEAIPEPIYPLILLLQPGIEQILEEFLPDQSTKNTPFCRDVYVESKGIVGSKNGSKSSTAKMDEIMFSYTYPVLA